MKNLLIATLALVMSVVVVAFLPIAPVGQQILIFMLGANACMALAFALLVSGENN